MSVTIANVSTTSDSFQIWIDKTNAALDTISRLSVTTEANTSGGQTTGNAHVNGFFSANLLSTNTLRGGNVAAAANLNITSNLHITGANLSTTANVLIVDANVFVNTTNMTVTGGTANLHSNVIINGNTLIISSNNVTVNSDVNYLLIQTANVTYAPALGGRLTINGDVVVDGTSMNVASDTTFTGSVDFAGDLLVSGSGQVDGNFKMGATPASVVSIVGVVNTSIVPDTNNVRDLGSESNYWNNIYVTNLNAGSIQFTGSLTDIVDLSANSVVINDLVTQYASSNGNIGSANVGGVMTPVPVYSFDAAAYRSAKIVATTYNEYTNNHTTSEMLVIHDGTTATMTVYATLSTNTATSTGEYSVTVDSGDVQILYKQPDNISNTDIKLHAVLTSSL